MINEHCCTYISSLGCLLFLVPLCVSTSSALTVIKHYTDAAAATTIPQRSIIPLVFACLCLLSVIEHSKEGEHCFVLTSVSFVRVDMEEGVKQLDKMALMCLKNLLSLIKAHTHAPQRQTERTRFSAASAE